MMNNREKEYIEAVNQNYKNVFGVVVRIVKNVQDAEDITQELFLKFYKTIYSFRNESKVSTLLYRMAYNMSIDFLRKSKHSNNSEQISDDIFIACDTAEPSDDRIKILIEAIKTLNIEQQTIITLFYFENRSVEEIAKIVSLSESNTKVKLHRIRKYLEEVIVREQNRYEK